MREVGAERVSGRDVAKSSCTTGSNRVEDKGGKSTGTSHGNSRWRYHYH